VIFGEILIFLLFVFGFSFIYRINKLDDNESLFSFIKSWYFE